MVTIQNTDSLIGNAALEFEPTVQCGRVMSLGSPEVSEMSVRPKNLRRQFHKKTERDRAMVTIGKGKVFPYSLPSVGPGADPGVQAVSPLVT